MDLRALGRAVVRRRRVMGLSRNALAVRAGMSATYLIDVELGESRVGAEVLAGLARALGTSVDELLGEAGWPVSESLEVS